MTEREPVTDRLQRVGSYQVWSCADRQITVSALWAAATSNWPLRLWSFEPTFKADIQEEPDD